MELSFMTGATVFALINFIVFVVALYIFVRGCMKMYSQWKEHKSFNDVQIPTSFFYIIIVGVASLFFNGVAQPKLSISTPINRDLIEYQTRSPEVTIETPPARTEELKGFKPLNEEN
jgi:hypothetical protein